MNTLHRGSLAAVVVVLILPVTLPGITAAQDADRQIRIRQRDDDRERRGDGRRDRDENRDDRRDRDDRGRREDGRDGRRDRDRDHGRWRDHDGRGHGERGRYWGNYWRWYDDDFRRYYHRRDRDLPRYRRGYDYGLDDRDRYYDDHGYGNDYGYGYRDGYYDRDYSHGYDDDNGYVWTYDPSSRWSGSDRYRYRYGYGWPYTGWRDSYYTPYGYRRDDHALHGRHNSLQLGPLHFDWR